MCWFDHQNVIPPEVIFCRARHMMNTDLAGNKHEMHFKVNIAQ